LSECEANIRVTQDNTELIVGALNLS
jgi:hypothetical protein